MVGDQLEVRGRIVGGQDLGEGNAHAAVYTGRMDVTGDGPEREKVADYLARIGASADDDLATLTDRHYRAVPFENLSIHLGEPIDTRPQALFDKIVRRRRGGLLLRAQRRCSPGCCASSGTTSRTSARACTARSATRCRWRTWRCG